MSQVVFITGTDTGAGKTLLSALLLRHLRQTGVQALAMKPFATGSQADSRRLSRLQDGMLPRPLLAPFFFADPVAPLVAARQARRRITLAKALAPIQAAAARCELLLVEGCGGLLAPLGPGYGALEIIARLRPRVLVAARNRLGVLNHALLTLRALRAAGVRPAAVVLMGCARPDVSARTNRALLAELAAPVPVVELPFLGRGASGEAAVKKNAKKLKKTLASLRELIKLGAVADGSATAARSGKSRKGPLTAARKAVVWPRF